MVREHTGRHAADGIHHNHGGKFTAGQHIVADRVGFRGEQLKRALVDTLVVPAEYQQLLFLSEHLRVRLCELFALRRHIDNTRRPAPLFRNRAIATEYRICLHEHARTAAVGRVVDMPVPLRRIISDISHIKADIALLLRSAEYADREPLLNHLRKERQNRKTHQMSPSMRCTFKKPSFGFTSRMQSLM